MKSACRVPFSGTVRLNRALPGRAGEVPIVEPTANAMKGDRESYLEAGMNEYVPKPVDPALLTTALRKLCGDDILASTGISSAAPAVARNEGIFEDFTDLLADIEALEKSMDDRGTA